MSRLLSEDAIIHSLMDFTKGKKTLGQCIDDTPTACDIEKVVEGLSDYAKYQGILRLTEDNCDNYVPIREVIKIVKEGRWIV